MSRANIRGSKWLRHKTWGHWNQQNRICWKRASWLELPSARWRPCLLQKRRVLPGSRTLGASLANTSRAREELSTGIDSNDCRIPPSRCR